MPAEPRVGSRLALLSWQTLEILLWILEIAKRKSQSDAVLNDNDTTSVCSERQFAINSKAGLEWFR